MAEVTPPAYPQNGNTLLRGFKEKPALLSNSFLIHFQEFSPNLHICMAKDYTHELLCKMTLEVKEIFVTLKEENEAKEYLAPVVACNFPSISLEKLNIKTGLDGYLQELLKGQFQLKILEQLLLFCKRQEAACIIFLVQDTDIGYLKFYRRFIASEKQVITEKGEQLQVVIPTVEKIYDDISDFMDKIDREFRCALWRGQSINPAFRAYLTLNSCL